MVDNLDFVINDSRDPNRSPMQWDSSVSGGFSTSSITWLPVEKSYRTINVQLATEATRSHYHHLKELTALRKETTIAMGALISKSITKNIFAFTR